MWNPAPQLPKFAIFYAISALAEAWVELERKWPDYLPSPWANNPGPLWAPTVEKVRAKYGRVSLRDAKELVRDAWQIYARTVVERQLLPPLKVGDYVILSSNRRGIITNTDGYVYTVKVLGDEKVIVLHEELEYATGC